MNFILIDTSYLIFYRYFALLQWWRLAHPDDELGNPSENKEFCEKFRKIMIESVETIKKKLKLHTTKKNQNNNNNVIVIAARDCHRKDIWRNKIYPQYKASREQDDNFMGGFFFKMVYNDELLKHVGCNHIIQENYLEADDIIAITKKYLRNTFPNSRIYIIANDMDYLQLWDWGCDIINLNMQKLIENKKSYPEADKNLFVKIIIGDKSDNISSVFKKCGVKEAEELYEDADKLEKKLKSDDAYEKLLINKLIIDFDEIPEKYVDRVLYKLKMIIT